MPRKPNIVLVDETLSIAAPVSDVFRFLSDHENYVRWYPGVAAVTSPDDLPPGTVGKVYHETLRLPSGRSTSFDIKVVECRAPELFVTEGALALIHPRMEMRLTARSAGETVLNLRFLSRNPSPLGRLLVRGLLKRSMRRQSRSGLQKLKTTLDRGGRAENS